MVVRGLTTTEANDMALMRYKGYSGRVELDEDAGAFHGEVINLRDVITFEGQSVEELQQAFEGSVEEYIAFCAERGEAPEKPASGRFVLRLPPEVHRRVVEAAARQSKSVNAWVRQVLEEAVGR